MASHLSSHTPSAISRFSVEHCRALSKRANLAPLGWQIRSSFSDKTCSPGPSSRHWKSNQSSATCPPEPSQNSRATSSTTSSRDSQDGSALFLPGLGGLGGIRLYGRSSLEENTIICWTMLIGSEIYFNRNNFICILQISWHPCSETHLGILSTDSVFRIFDFSTGFWKPEQEYYLQPVEPGSHKTAAGIRPVDFSYWGNHLWDRFSIIRTSALIHGRQQVHKAQDIGSKRLTEDLLFLLRKDFPKLNRCTELLSMNEELKQARKAFEVDEEKLALAD